MQLLQLYGERIVGAIRGLDRVRFRGTFRWLANAKGLEKYLSMSHILLKDFRDWAREKTLRMRAMCERRAEELGIEMRYLERASVDKEKLAREAAEEKGVRGGPIIMFRSVEPCVAPWVGGNQATKHLELTYRPRKCTWIYHYFDDPVLGFGHVRLQTWLPYTVHVCLNGRHRLEKQMQEEGIDFIKDGNCFTWVSDVARAQRLFDEQLETDWGQALRRLVLDTCPGLGDVMAPLDPDYYWSADETEWATDVMFHSAKDLNALYPSLIRHAMLVSDSPSVMRYFGKRNALANGKVIGVAADQIVSDCRRRYEGVRVKHWINRNSIKVYNKAGSVLRFETTINNTRDFKVFRCPDDDLSKPASWQKMRKGISDLHRRCQVSDQSNERYADAVACVGIKERLDSIMGDSCRPITRSGRRHRGLNPWGRDDSRLLRFLGRGELAHNGFRNKDLRSWLYGETKASSREACKRLSGKVTRLLGLLRAHGLIAKVSGVNRYVLSEKGRKLATAFLSASAAEISMLMEMAA
jgi:hypothetical protein